MLEVIKKIIQKRAGNTVFAEYYRARLVAIRNVIEEEATVYMSSLLPLYDWNTPDRKESK
jgi:hypothetical protein